MYFLLFFKFPQTPFKTEFFSKPPPPPPPRRCPYFDVVVGFAWSNDPERYVGFSVATVRASNAGQVKGDDPAKKGYPGPPCWRLGVKLQPHPIKT